jgi:hypothetical protein
MAGKEDPMKNFLYILDPGEEAKDYDESMEGFIGELAEKAGSNDFKEWKKRSSGQVKEIDYPCGVFYSTEEIFTEFLYMERTNYTGIGFAIGMAYAELISQRNDETRKILDSIKRKLKKSGLLPGERKGGNHGRKGTKRTM